MRRKRYAKLLNVIVLLAISMLIKYVVALIKIITSCILDDFLPQQPGFCSNEEDIYGEYMLRKFAELACSNDSQCIGIQDEGCNGIGVFRMCKNGFRNPSSSCIYHKKKNKGRYSFFPFLK